jgi:hypothetical protein
MKVKKTKHKLKQRKKMKNRRMWSPRRPSYKSGTHAW